MPFSHCVEFRWYKILHTKKIKITTCWTTESNFFLQSEQGVWFQSSIADRRDQSDHFSFKDNFFSLYKEQRFSQI